MAAKPSVVEVGLLFLFGFLGLLMRRWDYPVAPMVVGLILGPMAEAQLRRSLQLSLGDPMIENPGSAALLSLSAIALLAPFAMKGLSQFRAADD